MVCCIKARVGMAAHLISSSFLVSSFFLLSSFPLHSETACPPSHCGNLSRIDFPFFVITDEHYLNWDLKCGFLPINCSDGVPKYFSYLIKNISYKEKTLLLQDWNLLDRLQQGICGLLDQFEKPGYEFLRTPNLTLFNCNLTEYNPFEWPTEEYYNYTSCRGNEVLFFTEKEVIPTPKKGCTRRHQLPIQSSSSNSYRNDNLSSIVEAGFTHSWDISPSCISDCLPYNRPCKLEDITTGKFTCPAVPQKEGPAPAPQKEGAVPRKEGRKWIAIGVGVGTLFCIVIFASVSYLWYRQKRPTAAAPSRLLSRTISSYPSTKSEDGYYSTTFPTKIFSYKELQEATNNFDPSKELGNGGFGIVYHGKLRDGRSVAVKRLYKNHYKHIQQFMNEIEILSRLRHPNLVVLYGCTSHQSRELLLVYEFIPNGTLADHLHGNLAENGALTWRIRMSIAIETADALAHLHAVGIIHRDVKTNNILLDNNCHVKVADFGLSRLFPLDKTHVSTAPQGTIGYVDPDYHRCYQLNEKSDVYSFGVVLIELISSKPAVDLSRHQHEINLANLAINKICNQELHELIDPRLGFELDSSVGRMITMVAELALRCLHDEKDMRPSMQEVLEVLKGIENELHEVEKTEVGDLSIDKIANLKNIKPVSLDFLKNASTIKFNTPNATS